MEKVRNARQKEHFETARKRVLEAKALDAKLDAAEEAVDAQERAEARRWTPRSERSSRRARPCCAPAPLKLVCLPPTAHRSAVRPPTGRAKARLRGEESLRRLHAHLRAAKLRGAAERGGAIRESSDVCCRPERQARRDALQKAKDDYARASSEKKALVEGIRAQARAEREAVLNANKAHAAKERANDIIAVQAKARVLAEKRASAERVKKAGTAPAPKLRQLSATEAKLRRAPSSGSWYLLSRAPGQADPGMSRRGRAARGSGSVGGGWWTGVAQLRYKVVLRHTRTLSVSRIQFASSAPALSASCRASPSYRQRELVLAVSSIRSASA